MLFNVNIGFISLAYPFREGSCDGFWLKHWSMHVSRLDCLLLLSLLFLIRLSLPHANSSLRSIQSQRSVSVIPRFPRSVSASQFPFKFYRSRIYSSTTFSFSSSSFSTRLFTSFRSRHLNNMSPIMTFLVSGLLPFVSASLWRLLFWGFLPCPPYHSWPPVFLSVGVQVGCCLPVGSKIPAKLPFLSRRYDDIASRLWV